MRDEGYHNQVSKRWGAGHIYVIDYGDGKTFKIGTTKNQPSVRLGQINRNNVLMPMHLVMSMYVKSNSYYLEQLLHMKFDDYHVHGEWFSLDFGSMVELAQILNLNSYNKLVLYDRWYELFTTPDWREYERGCAISAHFPHFTREDEYDFDHAIENFMGTKEDGAE